MVGTNQPDEPEPSEQAAQPKDDDSLVETASEPQADEVEDLKVGDEELGDQVRGGGRKRGQDMDPY